MSENTLMSEEAQQAEVTEEATATESIESTDSASWLDGLNDLDDSVRTDPSLKPFKNVEGLVKSYVNAQKLIGADKVVVPGRDSGDEEWSKFYSKIGVPEKFEDYGVAAPEEDQDAEYFKTFLEKSHAAGLLPKQAQDLMDFQMSYASDQAKEAEARYQRQIEEQIEKFKEEEGDRFNETVLAAKLVVKQFDDEEETFNSLVAEDPSIGNNPKLIRFLARIANHLNEDTFRATAVSNVGTSAEEAQQKLNNIMADQEGPYWRKDHPDHNRVVSEVNKLMNVVMQG